MLRNVFLVIGFIAICIIVGWYSTRDAFDSPFSPILTKQINSSCPYYKDIWGQLFIKDTYTTTDPFFESSIESSWNRIPNINAYKFRIVKAIPREPEAPILSYYSYLGNECIGTDGNNAIYGTWVFPNADPESLQLLQNHAFKDKSHVYYTSGKIFEFADAATYEVITRKDCVSSQLYARDKKNVFYNFEVVTEADLDTFKPECTRNESDPHKARDKNHTYRNGEIENFGSVN